MPIQRRVETSILWRARQIREKCAPYFQGFVPTMEQLLSFLVDRGIERTINELDD